jgi:hypothetical protein
MGTTTFFANNSRRPRARSDNGLELCAQWPLLSEPIAGVGVNTYKFGLKKPFTEVSSE